MSTEIAQTELEKLQSSVRYLVEKIETFRQDVVRCRFKTEKDALAKTDYFLEMLQGHLKVMVTPEYSPDNSDALRSVIEEETSPF